MEDKKSMTQPQLRKRSNLSGYAWLIAFLLFPVGPYIALYFSGAITLLRSVNYAVLALALTSAYSFSMSKTEGNPDTQGWVVHSMLLFMGLVAVHQYCLGIKLHLWPRYGIRVWKRMAWIGFILYLLLVFSTIMKFLVPGIGKV
jgi:hypothetical protein